MGGNEEGRGGKLKDKGNREDGLYVADIAGVSKKAILGFESILLLQIL